MIVKQQPIFQPITITLETAKEAEALWNLVDYASGPQSRLELDDFNRKFAIGLSNWFSEKAQMGGLK